MTQLELFPVQEFLELQVRPDIVPTSTAERSTLCIQDLFDAGVSQRPLYRLLESYAGETPKQYHALQLYDHLQELRSHLPLYQLQFKFHARFSKVNNLTRFDEHIEHDLERYVTEHLAYKI